MNVAQGFDRALLAVVDRTGELARVVLALDETTGAARGGVVRAVSELTYRLADFCAVAGFALAERAPDGFVPQMGPALTPFAAAVTVADWVGRVCEAPAQHAAENVVSAIARFCRSCTPSIDFGATLAAAQERARQHPRGRHP